MTRPVGFALAAAATLLAACGGTGTSGTTTSSTQTGSGATPSPTPNLMPVMVTEAQNGITVAARRGVTVIVTLHSTYWKLDDGSDPSVVKLIGGPTVSPSPGCVPGQGCGTVVAEYGAVGDGQATISASRTACGEALRCVEAQSKFRVTVAVTG